MNRFALKNGIRLFLIVALFLVTTIITSLGAIMDPASAQDSKPTIVLVHGAFAESSSWNGVLTQLIPRGYPVVTVANPLRGVKSDAGKDLYIQQDKFHAQFAADVPANDAQLMASTQRPITEAALNEASDVPAWKSVPSWFIYGDRDLNIPAAALSFMAERANSNETVVVNGASHVVMVSHPDAVAAVIEHAAMSPQDRSANAQ